MVVFLCGFLQFIHVQNGATSLHTASQNGHTDVVDLLVRAGADVHLATTEVYMYIIHIGLYMYVHTVFYMTLCMEK